eukprot:362242-Chlamydomonas_euryale.AAC.1
MPVVACLLERHTFCAVKCALAFRRLRLCCRRLQTSGRPASPALASGCASKLLLPAVRHRGRASGCYVKLSGLEVDACHAVCQRRQCQQGSTHARTPSCAFALFTSCESHAGVGKFVPGRAVLPVCQGGRAPQRQSALLCTPLAPFCTPLVPFYTPLVPFCTPRVSLCTPLVPFCTPRVPFCTPRVPLCTPRVPLCTPRVHFVHIVCQGSATEAEPSVAREKGGLYTLVRVATLGARKPCHTSCACSDPSVLGQPCSRDQTPARPPHLPSTLPHARQAQGVARFQITLAAPPRPQYVLKREMWRAFDPHFLHYNRRTLSRAWERAVGVGGYRAHWQLSPPTLPLPPSLRGMCALLEHPDLYRLVWYVLHAACNNGGGNRGDGDSNGGVGDTAAAAPAARSSDALLVSEEALLSALNLLALQLNHLEAWLVTPTQSLTPTEPAASPSAVGSGLEEPAARHACAALRGGAACGRHLMPAGGIQVSCRPHPPRCVRLPCRLPMPHRPHLPRQSRRQSIATKMRRRRGTHIPGRPAATNEGVAQDHKP